MEKLTWPAGWEIVEKVGDGSFGEVYRIRRNVFGMIEEAALKVMTIPQNYNTIIEMKNDGYDDGSIAQICEEHLKNVLNEYHLMSKMKGNSNIVDCDDLYYEKQENGYGWRIFIKMELLTPLTTVIKTNAITEEQVIKVGKDIAKALELCERNNIIHRDIKPGNILISKDGWYKLGDFGIAKVADRASVGTKTGTYKYMAPEVYNNRPYGSSADICSLGLVLYYLLNEQRIPFLPLPPQIPTAEEAESAERRRFSGEPIPPPLHGSVELKRIVLKACEFDPRKRYQSASEMLNDLRALTDRTVIDDDRTVVEPPVSVTNPQPVNSQNKVLLPIVIASVVLIASICSVILLNKDKYNFIPTNMDTANTSTENTEGSSLEDTEDETSADTEIDAQSTHGTETVTVYNSENEAFEIPANELSRYKSEGFYAEPVVKVYKPAEWGKEGTERTIEKSKKESYLNDGWYSYPCRRLYAPGKNKVFKESDVEAQLTVGWYREPLVLLYDKNNNSAYFTVTEAPKLVSDGAWSYTEAKTAWTQAQADTPKPQASGTTETTSSNVIKELPSDGYSFYISELTDAKPTNDELLKFAKEAGPNLLKLKQYLEEGIYFGAYYSDSITASVDSSYTVWHPIDDSRVKSCNDIKKYVWDCYYTDDLDPETVLGKYRDIDGKLYTAAKSDSVSTTFSVKFTKISSRSDTSVQVGGEYTESGRSKQKIYLTFKYVNSKWRLSDIVIS